MRISSGSDTASSSCSREAASTVFSKAAIGDWPCGFGNGVEPDSYLQKQTKKNKTKQFLSQETFLPHFLHFSFEKKNNSFEPFKKIVSTGKYGYELVFVSLKRIMG